MTGYTKRRIIASVKLGLAAIPFVVVLRLVHGYELVPGTFLLGFIAGFMIGVVELFLLKNWLRNLSFPLHLIGKSIILIAITYASFAILNLLDVIVMGISWSEYFSIIIQEDTFFSLIEYFGVILFLLFFVNLDRLLGPGVLWGYVTGRYHRPRWEERIFMFLDLKGSTKLADEMDANLYFRFLHRYFAEMSEPILKTGAEIYQYVGDEVVLTWQMKNGLDENNCLRLFFLIEDQIRANREHFRSEFGVLPQFKAGVHSGTVISAQIGELKTEIVYNGDVLNIAARIQSLCNELGHKLLVSEELLNKLQLGPEYSVIDLGSILLRGKSYESRLSAVSRTE